MVLSLIDLQRSISLIMFLVQIKYPKTIFVLNGAYQL